MPKQNKGKYMYFGAETSEMVVRYPTAKKMQFKADIKALQGKYADLIRHESPEADLYNSVVSAAKKVIRKNGACCIGDVRKIVAADTSKVRDNMNKAIRKGLFEAYRCDGKVYYQLAKKIK